jgi:hypothetical protein
MLLLLDTLWDNQGYSDDINQQYYNLKMAKREKFTNENRQMSKECENYFVKLCCCFLHVQDEEKVNYCLH